MNTSSVLAVSALAVAAASFSTPGMAQSYAYDLQERPIPAARPSAGVAVRSGGDLPSSDRAPVISSTPVVRQVMVPPRSCADQPVAYQRQPSGAGALIGAVAGGAIGNAIGGGAGRAAATALGVVGGSALGNEVERGPDSSVTRLERRCSTQGVYEERTIGYDVVYEYGGREYTTRMRNDPGQYVQVNVQATAVGELLDAPRRGRPVPLAQAAPAPVYAEPYAAEPVYETYPVYPAAPYYGAYYSPSYVPFGTGLVLGAVIGSSFHHGHRGWGGGGWRGGRHR
jgi:uncharacterized protein YcfJ